MTTAHEQIELRSLVEDLLGVELSAAERAILSFRLGWDGQPWTQQQLAPSLGVSQTVLSKMERKLKDRMKRELADRGQEPRWRYVLNLTGTLRGLPDRRRVVDQAVRDRVG